MTRKYQILVSKLVVYRPYAGLINACTNILVVINMQ